MSKVLVNEENLTNIANAIREKNGETTTYKPSEMAGAIQNITTGGGSGADAMVEKTITGYSNSNITYIEDYTFYNCTMLIDVDFPNVADVRQGAFRSCSSLSNVNIPKLTNVGDNAFNGCTLLKEIYLPNVVTTGYNSFDTCTSLKNVTLSKIEKLGSATFQHCGSLIKIDLANTITQIGSACFNNCANLNIVIVRATNPPKLNSYVFNSTPITDNTGAIYVPDTSVSNYKSATNWSTYADQIKPISELEASA